jgi:hypothetical protein
MNKNRAAITMLALEMIESGKSLREAAADLGVALASLSRWVAAVRREGLAGLAPKPRGRRANCDLSRAIRSLPWFIPAARFFYLHTNRARGQGSVPEALRRVIALPELPVGWSDAVRARFLKSIGLAEVPACPEDLRAEIAQRLAGHWPVPFSIAREIRIAPALVRWHRNPREESLRLEAPGALFFIREGDARRPVRPGEVIEADDATINFPVIVPWELGGDPCSDRWGCRVGRFQLLLAVDAASRFVPAWEYVIRPRSSYRAEDILALMHAHVVEHGAPRAWRFEQGAWKSKLVQHAARAVGSKLVTVFNPHSKAFVEGLINPLWTKLSVQFPDAQLGRFRGEHREAALELEAVRRGHRDPRGLFPDVNTALRAIEAVIAEKNATPVRSDVGQWIPRERWEQRERRVQMVFDDWMFAPFVREWKVRGCLVGGRVRIFEDLAVPFDFSAPWLHEFDGARVRCHFNPYADKCRAMLVLLESRGSHRAGDQLGYADQVNEIAGYTRLVLGWGEDPAEAGRLAKQQAAAAMRREVRAVAATGRGFARSEARDGVARAAVLDRDGSRDLAREIAPVEISTARLERAERFATEIALD